MQTREKGEKKKREGGLFEALRAVLSSSQDRLRALLETKTVLSSLPEPSRAAKRRLRKAPLFKEYTVGRFGGPREVTHGSDPRWVTSAPGGRNAHCSSVWLIF